MSPFEEAARRKLIVTSLCQGMHGRWHCYLRDRKEKIVGTAFDCSSAELALLTALGVSAPHGFEDLLG